MNKVILIGRLVKNPEIKELGKNKKVCNFSLAVPKRFVKKGEERQADFLNIVAWDNVSDFCSKYFKKGQQVGIVGRIETGSYDDKDGKKVFTTHIIADEVYFADSSPNSK